MDVESVERIINDYVDWWRREIKVLPAGNGVRIVSPMLDRHNDHMSMYIAEDAAGGGYILTDLGETIGDLVASGCDVLSSDSRRKKLDGVAAGMGLQREGNELFRRAGESDLFQSINFLMQGMATVDDLFFTSSDQARSFFLDDLDDWFEKNGVPVVPNVRVGGKSGFETRLDFVIPRIGGKLERLIKAVGNPRQGSVENALFGFGDISDSRPNSECLLVMDVTGGRGGDERVGELSDACRRYGAKPIAWTGPDGDYVDLLAA